MSYQSNSDRVLRRTGFYSNALYKLQSLIMDIKGNQGCKWCVEEDNETMRSILTLLSKVEIRITNRYQTVLGERTEDLLSSLVTENVLDILAHTEGNSKEETCDDE